MPNELSSNNEINKHIHPSYTDDNLSIIDEVTDLENLPNSVRMESYVVVALNQGNASFMVDGVSYEMKTNHIVMLSPYIMVERMVVSPDAKFSILVITQKYAKELTTMDGTNAWKLLLYISHRPVLLLSEEQAQNFSNYHSLIKYNLSEHPTLLRQQIINYIFLAAICEFRDIIDQHDNMSKTKFSSSETIFQRFYEILNNTTPKRRPVEYYAQQLNITPKYFSSVCKQLTGQTALQHITNAVLKDVVRMLRDPQMSIKQIAQAAGFPNQSFLGSFVRKHLGISPYKYRSSMGVEKK